MNLNTRYGTTEFLYITTTRIVNSLVGMYYDLSTAASGSRCPTTTKTDEQTQNEQPERSEAAVVPLEVLGVTERATENVGDKAVEAQRENDDTTS